MTHTNEDHQRRAANALKGLILLLEALPPTIPIPAEPLAAQLSLIDMEMQRARGELEDA